VRLLQNLSHPNIVVSIETDLLFIIWIDEVYHSSDFASYSCPQRYLGVVQEEETINILLEFVPGGSISSLLGKFGPFPEPVSLWLFANWACSYQVTQGKSCVLTWAGYKNLHQAIIAGVGVFTQQWNYAQGH